MKIFNRIKKSDDFLVTIKKGKAYRCNEFTVHKYQTNLGYTRVGLSVSSKLGNAVVRNRIKRQLRAMCDSLLDYESSSVDIVIIVRSPFLQGTYNSNKEHLFNLLNTQAGKKQWKEKQDL